MTGESWRNYRSGYPRHSEALERLARHRGAKFGYRVHKLGKSPADAGRYMLVHRVNSAVVLGAGYTASIEAILEFIEGVGG
jgi:hypothetical protein